MTGKAMNRTLAVITVALGTLFTYPAHAASAEIKYPTRPIRFVVGFLPGGPSDTIARVVSAKLAEGLGQPVIVENRAGAGGNVSADIVAGANPDGHTILLGTGGPLVIAPIIGQKIQFDPDRDFAPVSTLGGSMSILAANPTLPANNVKELIALAKAKPGEINYASSGVGAANHLAAELLSSVAGIKLTHVPYKGSGAALPALISGEVKLGFGPILPAIPHVKAGRLKALGVSGLKRASAAPDIPTIAEQGFPGFQVDSWYGVFVPAKTPKPIVMQLNREINRIMALPDVKERLSRDGVDPAGSTPEALSAIVQNEKKTWTKVIRQANIKIQ
jgi:tripartite-type tricarboxylate transporter receptor subunit TctC